MTTPLFDELRRALGPDRPIRVLGSTGSTNEDAMAWAGESDPAPHGACVIADEQLVGRGRWGRSWASAPGKALMFSVVLRPDDLPPERLGLLTSAMGVACAEAIGDLAPLAPTLKWPNDVLIRSRKVAGILFETQMVGSRAAAVVAGVGVNTDWSLDEIPAELRERATSLAIEVDEPPGRGELLAAILDRFEPIYRGVCDGTGVDRLVERADELSELRDQAVDVTWPDRRVTQAIARGLSDSGGLTVEIGGVEEIVDIGEVTMIRGAER